MSLLQEIQNDIVNPTVELANILRKCKILAYHLNLDEFKQWVDNELNGYPEMAVLPTYRYHRCPAQGYFHNRFSYMPDADIPMASIPKEHRDIHQNVSFVESIGEIQDIISSARSSDKQSFHRLWEPNFVALHCSGIYKEMQCLKAWNIVTVSQFVNILENVKNRIQTFILEVRANIPNAEEVPSLTIPQQEKLMQIYNTTIQGDVQNLAQNSTDVTQHIVFNDANTETFSKLISAIEASQIQASIQSELIVIIQEMRDSQTPSQFREKYSKFMGSLADHMQVVGTVVAPFLPQLSTLLPT